MDTLKDTEWDLVISGTGLPQSLLALALSRSGKKVLHVDHNHFYGGADAALSLQDAETWVRTINEQKVEQQTTQTLESGSSNHRSIPAIFQDPEIVVPTLEVNDPASPSPVPQLGYSRAYSVALAPQIIYTRSPLLPTLVSSKVYRQLEFLAVGSWWLYETPKETSDVVPSSTKTKVQGRLKKIPGGREDVFADKTIDLKSKRALMKFLRLAADADAQQSVLEEWGGRSFQEYLTSQFGLSLELQSALHALTLSSQPPTLTQTSYALPRITRHLASIGIFGPGFGSVIPKWGGMAEIAQVACRAGAVGGGVYVLGKAVNSISGNDHIPEISDQRRLRIGLKGADTVRTDWIAGSDHDLPPLSNTTANHESTPYLSRSISIISSPLSELFPLAAEGAPPPAGAVVVFPAGSIKSADLLPVYFMIHSSDTGECPADQCVIYASTLQSGPQGFELLELAMQNFFMALAEEKRPTVLWKLQYSQRQPAQEYESRPKVTINDGVISFAESGTDLAFDDSILIDVREAWNKISSDAAGFMQFEDREVGAYDDEDI